MRFGIRFSHGESVPPDAEEDFARSSVSPMCRLVAPSARLSGRSGAPFVIRDIARAEESVDPSGHRVNDDREGFEARLGKMQ
jgi:hypothetical protein